MSAALRSLSRLRHLLSLAVVASFLACLALACLVMAACDDSDQQGETSPTPSPTAEATRVILPTLTPSPTARPTLDAATRFGDIHSVALPALESAVEGTASWIPLRLVPGSHVFLVYSLPSFLPCEVEGCQFPPGDPEKPGRLALWDPQTGTVNEFRAMETGKEAAATGSDGRFLVWEEGGYGAGGWRLYALEFSTMQWWHVDTDFGIVSGNDWVSSGDVAFVVGNGYLVYAAAIGYLPGGSVYEMRSYNLVERTGRVLELSGDVPYGVIGSSTWGTAQSGVVMGRVSPLSVDENANVVWIGPRLVETSDCDDDPYCYSAYSTDLATGETRVLYQEGTKHDPDLLLLLTGSSQGRNPGQSRWAEYVQAVGGFAVWVNRPENEAMAFEQGTGDLIKLSNCDAGFVAADEGRIYWTCWETDQNGEHRATLYWVETQ